MRALAFAAATAAVASGCALVLGFEDTQLDDRSRLDATIPPNDGSAPPDGDGAATTATLSVEPARIVVARGAAVDVKVRLARLDEAGAVDVAFEGLPSGVTAPAATIAASSSEVTVRVRASTTATLGSKTLTLRASTPDIPSIEVPLLVSQSPGAPDDTFGSGGIAVDSLVATAYFALAPTANGSVYAAGARTDPAAQWIARRYRADGTVDSGFSAQIAGLAGEVRAVVVDEARGYVYLGGTSQAAPATQLTVVRLLPSGVVDTTFATMGVFRPALAAGSVGYALALDGDGRVLFAGAVPDAPELGIVGRLTTAGALDTTFNTTGYYAAPSGNQGRFVAVVAEGRSVVAGGSLAGGGMAVVRLLEDGRPDATFGGASGTVVVSAGNTAQALARATDGSYTLVGGTRDASVDYAAATIGATGAPTYFGAVARATAAPALLTGVAAQADGLVVAAGKGGVVPDTHELRVLRFAPASGLLDGRFANAGALTIPGGGDAGVLLPSAVAIAADGRILVAGARTALADRGLLMRIWP